jgi:hypothetical protein
MGAISRTFRYLMAVVLACAVGSVPSCGTMGGGGMKYLAEPPPAAGAVSV